MNSLRRTSVGVLTLQLTVGKQYAMPGNSRISPGNDANRRDKSGMPGACEHELPSFKQGAAHFVAVACQSVYFYCWSSSFSLLAQVKLYSNKGVLSVFQAS
jgi:hypothetical protein